MVEQACLASLRAKFHVGGMTWADFTRVYFGVVYVTRGDFYDGSEKGTASVH